MAYAGSERAAEDVGFYCAANALGRFFGSLMSGLLYQWSGLMYSLIGSAVMLAICWLNTLALPDRVAAKPPAGPAALPDANAPPGLVPAAAATHEALRSERG